MTEEFNKHMGKYKKVDSVPIKASQKEFSLSEHEGRSEILGNALGIDEEYWYPKNKVKEFIRIILEHIDTLVTVRIWAKRDLKEFINKLAGEKLR